jgi:HD superfamily phosphohydrolase
VNSENVHEANSTGGLRYDFVRTLDPRLLDDDEPLYFEIAATRACKRLESISFLNAIEYLVRRPNGRAGSRRYSRQQHSLSIARLAGRYCQLEGMDFRSRRLARAAGLLHDIGHAPLSHSLEPVFKERFGIDHYRATAIIIEVEVADGSVGSTLTRFGVDADELLSLIEGKHGPFQGVSADPPINIQ